MPSLFSRARTHSASKKAHDELGRLPSRDGPRPVPGSPLPAFLPFALDPRAHAPRLPDYGFLAFERHVILAPTQLARLVAVVTDELSSRGGITTPFIFSTTALDVSYSSVKRLIRAFLDTCDLRSCPSADKAETKWRDEARFAGLHELAVCLRWGLARVVRMSKGQEVHGLIGWDHYVRFRETEAANRYPSGHFHTFLDDLPPVIHSIVTTVLTLLTRLTANSTSSGHSPPSLSPLFGPLFFGLGPASLSFHQTYYLYLRATNAMEHIILAFIRWQDTPRTGPSAALGVPVRLKDWIKGYPAMLSFLNDPKKDTTPQPRKGARTIRLLSVRRNVRMYSPDLVKSGATWGSRITPRSSPGPSNALYVSKEWDRIAPLTLKLPPRFSDSFKKRMNLPPNIHPDAGSGYESTPVSHASSTSSYKSAVSTVNSVGSSELGMLAPREGEDRFKSLTDLKWGEFESMGFGGLGDDKKLEFDLTESARQERSRKRQTLSWNDFSTAGFSRSDAPLSTTLQLSSPVSNSITSWPSQKAELSKKLKKAERSLPHFGWDTEPVVFNEEVIEEAFVDVFCDLIYGSGWMDAERCEDVERDCNWAMVEFKATPLSLTTSGGSDPRTTTSLVLFQEFVPLEYRQKLAQSSSNKRRLPSLFSTKSKHWKQAATLNGKPYEVGHVPRSPTYHEVEFDAMLHADNATKVISLAAPQPRASTISSLGIELKRSESYHLPPVPPKEMQVPKDSLPALPKNDSQHSVDSTPSSKRTSRFRLPATPILAVPSPASVRRKSAIPPAQYSIVEFETRLASYSDDEYNNANETESAKQRRRRSKDDAWVDILVGNKLPRLLLPGEQDAVKRMSLRGAHSDPDLASMEVAQVLAAVKNRPPSPSPSSSSSPPPPQNEVDRVDRDFGLDLHVQDLDVDEIETVPRTSGVTTGSSGYSERGANGDAEDNDHDHDHGHEQHENENEEDVKDGKDERLKEAVSKVRLKARRGQPGYFDLHPERRPPTSSLDLEEELRAKLERDTDEERQEAGRQAEKGEEGDEEDEEGEEEESHQDKTPVQETMPVPELVQEPQVQVQRPPSPPPPQLAVNVDVNEAAENGNGHGQHVAESKPGVPQSRTAALIKMYRERDRAQKAQSQSPSQPSPQTQPQPQPTPIALQVVSIPPAPVIVPASRIPVPVPVPTEEQTTTHHQPVVVESEPMQIALEEFEQPSPGRYVHGAPLNNVLEEEEEEY